MVFKIQENIYSSKNNFQNIESSENVYSFTTVNLIDLEGPVWSIETKIHCFDISNTSIELHRNVHVHIV